MASAAAAVAAAVGKEPVWENWDRKMPTKESIPPKNWVWADDVLTEEHCVGRQEECCHLD